MHLTWVYMNFRVDIYKRRKEIIFLRPCWNACSPQKISYSYSPHQGHVSSVVWETHTKAEFAKLYAPSSFRIFHCTLQVQPFYSSSNSTTWLGGFSSLEISCSGVSYSFHPHFTRAHVEPQINNQGIQSFLTFYLLEHFFLLQICMYCEVKLVSA